MSYQPPPQNPKRETDAAFKFLGMSGGILLLTIAVVIVLPGLICVLCCGGGIVNSIVNPTPTLTP